MTDVNERQNGSGGDSRWSEPSGEKIAISTTRFGQIEVPIEKVVEFPEGLVGFPEHRRYSIIANPSGGPFQWLQSVDEPGLAFVVVEPEIFFANYDVPVTTEQLEPLTLEDPDDAIILVILVVPPNNPRGITANLQGPIVVNPRARLARQLVLQVPEYTTRHPIFSDQDVDGERTSARDTDTDTVGSLKGGR